MRITLAQLNPTIGDIEGNLKKALDALRFAATDNSDLVIFPELFLTGYPPRDLLFHKQFIERAESAVEELKKSSTGYPDTGVLIGLPVKTGLNKGRGLYNNAILINNGQIVFSQSKVLLPTYDVFDETRYFDPAPSSACFTFGQETLGITVCEDAWQSGPVSPVKKLVSAGATVIINISASPFNVSKEEVRYKLFSEHARKHGVPFVYVNQVGGNDELIFDGRSMIIDKNGLIRTILPSFQEKLLTVDISFNDSSAPYKAEEKIETVYKALVLGTRDYFAKCGFKKAVLGLSGGIDSAVTACIAAAALGPENVLGITMPSVYSSEGSISDSRDLAANLGMEFRIIPIGDVFAAYKTTLEPQFLDTKEDITEENLQARTRGNFLMAFSNKYGYLVLSTGNKSELSVGYCTLYGDMSGGLAVISDVPKTMIYELAAYINKIHAAIPQATITKAPSAELRLDQTDQDTLPPYDMLDHILYYYIEEKLSAQDIIARGMRSETVNWVIQAVNRSEYKRRQSAPGLKITTTAFGIGRRYPIAAKY